MVGCRVEFPGFSSIVVHRHEHRCLVCRPMTIADAALEATCSDLDLALGALLDAGFRIDRISPADRPSEADVSGFGTRLRVRQVAPADLSPVTLHLSDLADQHKQEPATIDWPTNWTVRRSSVEPEVRLPPMQHELVISRAEEADLGAGRAGMLYRDLIPSRHGGRFIASHIHIPDGGPVPDYVHYHRIRFQLIFCARGWARLVYQDQGEPFVMQAGDAVLQPPQIRHRVLESSDAFEVVEIGCPAEHDTFADHDLELPTAVVDRDRDFGGQRFVWHRAEGAVYGPWEHPGFEARNTGIDESTDGLADVRVARPLGQTGPGPGTDRQLLRHDDEFRFHFVLEGATTLHLDGRESVELRRGDSVSIPASLGHRFDPSPGLELLDVRIP